MGWQMDCHPGGLELTQELIQSAGLTPDSLILDLGCGIGASSQMLAESGYRAVGVDREPRTKPGLNSMIVQADIASLPFGTACADACLMECVFRSLSDLQAVLQSCYRVLKPAGMLLVNDLYLAETASDRAGSVRSKTEILNEIESCGFKLINWQDQTAKLQSARLKWLWENEENHCQSREKTSGWRYFSLSARSLKKDFS
jgi:ubiquinone/menaquinone biosynthesis C-methylase UbiE